MTELNNVNLNKADSCSVAKAAVAILIEKKAINIRLYEVGEDNPMTDYYINATGRSLTQVAALADELVFKLSEAGLNDGKIEGKRGNSWILIDYGAVIINVFDKESREFYNLDRLMPESSLRDISNIEKIVDEKMKINNTEE